MPEAFIDEIFAAFAAHGAEQYGERVTQLDHVLQCAHLAAADGAPESLVVAALLHGEHEALGALSLSAWFDADVTRPIALHVAAKRYLCATDPGYFAALSEASKLSLELQGGVFTPAEADHFATLPFAAEAARLRRWDDDGKVVDLAGVAPLESYRPLLVRCAKG
jgi:predicted HD phosphohydrolase